MGGGTQRTSALILRCTKHATKSGGSVGKVRPRSSRHLFCMCIVTKLCYARDGCISFCDMEPPAQLMDSFMVRGDNQIMSLEILSIALGKHMLSLCASLFNVITSWCRFVKLCGRNCRSQSGGVVRQHRGGSRYAKRYMCTANDFRVCKRMWHMTGATKNFDQNCLIHAIWKKLVQLDTSVWIERVPTKDNISDLPSRWPCF